jgi:penicillin-binding protein 2
MGDYAGISGVERSYEDWLRGERGVKYRVVDVHNREIGNYQNGLFDKEAVAGKNITLTLDIELQAYAEELMQNKKGSIVAIEPATGEILAFVSSPSYDPALLSGRMHGKGMIELSQDKLRQPLFNRALMAAYPPGSTFKPLVGLMR